MLKVHHLENSQSIRILWLLEEIGADYELQVYERDPLTSLANAEFKKKFALGTSPVITDGDLVLYETNAIVDYILDLNEGKTKLRPKIGDENRSQYLFWFHASQGSLQPLMTMMRIFNIMKSKVPFFLRPLIKMVLGKTEKIIINPRCEAIINKAQEDLSKTKWLAGNQLTAADIVMGFTLEKAIERFPITQEKHSQIFGFIKNMNDLLSYQRALKKIAAKTSKNPS